MKEHRLLAVFAHPDDEAYRPGGTLALLAWRGVRVWVESTLGGRLRFRFHFAHRRLISLIFTVPSVTQT